MSYEEFCKAIKDAAIKAGIRREPDFSHDTEKGQYIGRADGLLFFGRPSSRSISVKRRNHDMMVWKLA